MTKQEVDNETPKASTYDKVAHTIGAGAVGYLTMVAAGAVTGVPGWIAIVAGVIAIATGASTNKMPVFKR